MRTFEEYQRWLEGFGEVVEPPCWWESIGLTEPSERSEKNKLLHNCTIIDNSTFEITANPQEITKILREYGLVFNFRNESNKNTNKPKLTDHYSLPHDSHFNFWHLYNPDGNSWGEGFFNLQNIPNRNLHVLGKHGSIDRYRLTEAKFIINNRLECNHGSDNDRQILDGRKLLLYLLQRIREERMPAVFHLNSGIFVYNDPKETLEKLV